MNTAENDCQPNPCQNNGTCLDGVGNFLCNCQEQFMGQTCTESKKIYKLCIVCIYINMFTYGIDMCVDLHKS